MDEEIWEFDDVPMNYQTTEDQIKAHFRNTKTMDEMDRDFKQLNLDNQAFLVENKHEILPPILRPEYADALINVINKLEPFAFANLSQSCRYLYDVCCNAKGIKIPLNCIFEVDSEGFTNVWIGERKHGLYEYKQNWKKLFLERFKDLFKKKAKQFRIHVELVCLCMGLPFLDGECWQFWEARPFLELIGCVSTQSLWLTYPNNNGRPNMPESEREQLIEFIEEFGVKEFRSSSPLDYDTTTYLLRNMIYFRHDNDAFSIQYLGQKVPPRLHMQNIENFDTFVEILKAWSRGDFNCEEWMFETFRLPLDVDDFLVHFSWYCIRGPFFRFPLPSARPLLLMDVEKFLPRFLLRSDGQILGMYLDRNNRVCLRQLKPVYLHRDLPMLFPIVEKEGEVEAPILCPGNAEALVNIINKLDPFAFARLSKTCHYLYDFCWNTEGIKVPLNCIVDVDGDREITGWIGDKEHFYKSQYDRLTSVKIQDLLRNGREEQFHIRVDLVCVQRNPVLGTWHIATAVQFLDEIGCEMVEVLWLRNGYDKLVPSADLIYLVKSFGVKEFISDATFGQDAIIHLIRNMTSLELYYEDFPEFDLSGRVTPRLLMGGWHDFDIFEKILMAWARCDIDFEEWSLTCRNHLSDIVDSKIPSYSILDSSFRFPLPSARPLILSGDGTMEKFSHYLLRSDGQILEMLYDKRQYMVSLRQLNSIDLHRQLPILFPTVEKE